MMSSKETTLDRVLDLTKQLSPSEQLELISRLSERMRHAVDAEAQAPVDMLSLAGLGAELWQAVDVDAYLREERESWER